MHLIKPDHYRKMLAGQLAGQSAGSGEPVAPSRRGFLQGVAAIGGALVIGLHLETGKAFAAAAKDGPMPNAFVRIAPDSTVTVLIKHLDMGQGVTTGLATIVAEELDADWSQMRAAFAPADALLYNNLAFGPVQGTGGSTSVANSWEQLRKAGAAARHMLVAAAAEKWGVPASSITIDKGRLASGSHSGSFGEFAEAAAKLPVPTEVTLKDPKDFRLIGTRLPRLDSADKTDGKAIYALDIRRPGMLTAVLRRPDRFGATLKSFDATAAKKVPGVVEVVAVPNGIAVLATNTWAAIQGREALADIVWDEANAEMRSTPELMTAYKQLATTPGTSAAKRGDAAKGLSGAAKVIEAEFEFPYLAHAPMEPLNCVIEKTGDGVTIWTGSQFQTIEQAVTAGIMGIKLEQVKIETLWAGGSFGRRANPPADYVAEAATILKAIDGRAPVHLVWTREDDIKGGYYRPMFYHKVRAGVTADGKIAGWEQQIVGQSFIVGTPFEAFIVKNGVDGTSVEGASDTNYDIGNFAVDLHTVPSKVPTLWWRSVGHTHTAQAVEVMIDELAHAAGRDPVEFRMELLKDKPRHAAVLKLLAEKANWGPKAGQGKGRGLALHESFDTVVGSVIDVSVVDGQIKVDKVICAVDCGIAINPDVIAAQIEGGVGFGLGAALHDEITLDKGLVEQSNFDGFIPLRMSEMPKVEVHILPSANAPTGIGEPGVPGVAPALSNAIFDATGQRLRSLPFKLEDFKA
ncbi:xanthine dehydrogenase family protein molybdopterin-binding subunit [Ancylobacter sp. A5.8]|uniref:xanthine dehydrogenase family protein molybdopterin-binding subunit n=1 Tax=Ancylobacter gelatini TaxID=2919920 RepID=UPI001F4E265F|nr:xanthine dehydrogenase family protein molybdopterin-binding subunit [Ancylobacter gelatini]MCJ8142208.1 xanthine dehydrogenase family protein molybdopterin-binding subunit [Ancylobacter gelatini]